jgi:predicted acetyltransferase
MGETEQFLEVFCAAFQLDRDAARPLFYRDPFFNLSFKRICLIPVDDSSSTRAVSCLTVVPAPLRVGSAVVPMTGIAGVATLPELRRRGYAAALLTDTIRKGCGAATELSFPIMGLFPADPDYYARFGFAHASTAHKWTCARTALPQGDFSGLRLADPLNPFDACAIVCLQSALCRTRTGACVRGTARWRVINEMVAGRETMIFPEADGIGGYLHIERDPKRSTIVVHEMHALSKAAAGALLAFLGAQTDFDAVEWYAASDDLDYFDAASLGTVSADPDAMMRIVDLKAAFDAVHSELYAPALAGGGRSLTVMARDAINAENEQPVTIDADGVRHGVIGTHAIAGDIGTITQLFVGYRTPAQLHATGALHITDPQSLALAEALFPPRNPQIPALDRF